MPRSAYISSLIHLPTTLLDTKAYQWNPKFSKFYPQNSLNYKKKNYSTRGYLKNALIDMYMKFHWPSAKNLETFDFLRNCQKFQSFAHKIDKIQKFKNPALEISKECFAWCIYQISLR